MNGSVHDAGATRNVANEVEIALEGSNRWTDLSNAEKLECVSEKDSYVFLPHVHPPVFLC